MRNTMTGQEAKQIRERLGLTQEQLARRLDISTASVAKNEQAKRVSSHHRAIMLLLKSP